MNHTINKRVVSRGNIGISDMEVDIGENWDQELKNLGMWIDILEIFK